MIRTVLRTEHVTMQFGGVIAVNDLNIVVKEHEIIALSVPTAPARPRRSTTLPAYIRLRRAVSFIHPPKAAR